VDIALLVSVIDYLVYAAYGDCPGIIIIICFWVRKKGKETESRCLPCWWRAAHPEAQSIFADGTCHFFPWPPISRTVMLLRAQFHRLLAYLSCDEKDNLAQSHQLAPSTPAMSSSVGEKTTACVTGGCGYVASALIKMLLEPRSDSLFFLQPSSIVSARLQSLICTPFLRQSHCLMFMHALCNVDDMAKNSHLKDLQALGPLQVLRADLDEEAFHTNRYVCKIIITNMVK